MNMLVVGAVALGPGRSCANVDELWGTYPAGETITKQWRKNAS